jgi:cell division protein ZapA
MSEQKIKQVDVHLLGQSYKLSCKEGEDVALLTAARFLDDKMSVIRDAGKVKGTDRIAVMAALSIAIDFLATKSNDGPFSAMTLADVNAKIAQMNENLDLALTPQENLF